MNHGGTPIDDPHRDKVYPAGSPLPSREPYKNSIVPSFGDTFKHLYPQPEGLYFHPYQRNYLPLLHPAYQPHLARKPAIHAGLLQYLDGQGFSGEYGPTGRDNRKFSEPEPDPPPAPTVAWMPPEEESPPQKKKKKKKKRKEEEEEEEEESSKPQEKEDPFRSESEDSFEEDFMGPQSDGSRVWDGDGEDTKASFILRKEHEETPWRPGGPVIHVSAIWNLLCRCDRLPPIA